MVCPSLEAFKEGIKLPAIDIIFYDYFVTSSVGDSAWKQSCLEAEDAMDPIVNPIVNPQGEAFALILLKNNYFAWLWEAKLALGDRLITNYDTPKEWELVGEMSEDVVLKCHIDLGVQEDKHDWDKILVKVDGGNPRKYDLLRKANDTKPKQLRLLASNSAKYKKFKEALNEGCDQSSSSSMDEAATTESRSKKRKVLKEFCEYTNPKDEEGKFNGWSTRAAIDMRDSIRALTNVGPKERLFRRVYCHIYQDNKGSARKKKRVQNQLALLTMRWRCGVSLQQILKCKSKSCNISNTVTIQIIDRSYQ
jgi:hypothetical protein